MKWKFCFISLIRLEDFDFSRWILRFLSKGLSKIRSKNFWQGFAFCHYWRYISFKLYLFFSITALNKHYQISKCQQRKVKIYEFWKNYLWKKSNCLTEFVIPIGLFTKFLFKCNRQERTRCLSITLEREVDLEICQWKNEKLFSISWTVES